MAGESRAAMIEAASTLFRRQGYEATSWREITRTSGAPAGSIGFLFPDGKEQLAAEAVAQVGEAPRDLAASLLSGADDPVEAGRRWILASADVLERSGYTDACPVATVALELSHRSDRVQVEVVRAYDSWREVIVDRFAGRYGPETSRTIAEIFLAAFEGALLLSRAERSTRPLITLAGNLDRLVAALADVP